MFEMVKLLAETNFSLLVFSVLIFDIPRYSLSLLSLALFGAWRRSDRVPASNASVSVVIPTFNGGSGLGPTIASLQRQTLRPFEIIVVDDGSTDETRSVAERARALGLVDMVICHGTRCGRSAAINAAARFASGDLLLTVDADTVFEPTAVARLAAVFSDPRVGGASCNIAISNERESLWTGLQSVEYLKGTSNNVRGHKFGLGPVFDCLPGFFFRPLLRLEHCRRLHRLHAAASRSSVTRRRML